PGVLRHAAWYDEGDGDYTELRALTARVQGEELGLPGRIVWGDAQRQARLAEEPSSARVDAALRAGLTSTCAFPVMVRHEVVGVLELMSDGGREADLTLLQVMHHVGVQLGRVVERDRAERRLARHARQLERLTHQLDSVLNSAGEGICGLDAHGVVTFVNEAGAALLGATREELVGRPAVDVLPLADEHGEGTEPITDGERRLHTGTVQRADGTEFDCELVAARTRDDDETVGTVVVFRDVSERKAVDRLKDEFTSVMSHELRTPLTSVRGALGLLGGGATGELPSRAARMVEVATASTDRLIRLVNDILDVERMAAGRLTLHRGEHKATILVQTALAETAGLAADAGVLLIADPAPGTVWADPDRVVQVLTNLIGNAVKFSPGGAPVVVGSEVDGDVVRFHVRDDGPGIPDDQLDSIFERFRQADASDTRSRGGTGLGLTISRGLVRQHGGRIWAANRPGGGSTFSFELPREEHP
ncbi:MAG TPA: ATP-binding protein, partial [Nocardioidaceae bacterium]|nr:ATP-binding protein [Nocardioidaceae bacterium]